MKITQLKELGRYRVRFSHTEMSLLSKIVEAGLFALEGAEADGISPLTPGERRSMAYWNNRNPFQGLGGPKPQGRPRTAGEPKAGETHQPAPKPRPRASGATG